MFIAIANNKECNFDILTPPNCYQYRDDNNLIIADFYNF